MTHAVTHVKSPLANAELRCFPCSPWRHHAGIAALLDNLSYDTTGVKARHAGHHIGRMRDPDNARSRNLRLTACSATLCAFVLLSRLGVSSAH